MHTPPPQPNPAPTQSNQRLTPRAWATFVGVTIASLAADLWSKALAFAHVADAPAVFTRTQAVAKGPARLYELIPIHDPRVVVPTLLDFTLVLNPGAVFGIGAGKRWFFVIFTGIAAVACVVMFLRWTRAQDRALHAALGMVLGGGLGNLYDRLKFACVRDFIHPLPQMRLPFRWSWPWGGNEVWPYVSNVADLLLIIGVVMLAWRTMHTKR